VTIYVCGSPGKAFLIIALMFAAFFFGKISIA
jgi:hypothetical protein